MVVNVHIDPPVMVKPEGGRGRPTAVCIAAIGRVKDLGCVTHIVDGRIVGHGNVQRIAGIDVQGRIFQAARTS